MTATTTGASPITVGCDHCDARPQHRCKRPSGDLLRPGEYHDARVRAAAIRCESDEEMSRA